MYVNHLSYALTHACTQSLLLISKPATVPVTGTLHTTTTTYTERPRGCGEFQQHAFKCGSLKRLTQVLDSRLTVTETSPSPTCTTAARRHAHWWVVGGCVHAPGSAGGLRNTTALEPAASAAGLLACGLLIAASGRTATSCPCRCVEVGLFGGPKSWRVIRRLSTLGANLSTTVCVCPARARKVNTTSPPDMRMRQECARALVVRLQHSRHGQIMSTPCQHGEAGAVTAVVRARPAHDVLQYLRAPFSTHCLLFAHMRTL